MIERITPDGTDESGPTATDLIYAYLRADNEPNTFEGLVSLLGTRLDVVSLRRGIRRLMDDRWVDVLVDAYAARVWYMAEERQRSTPADVWGCLEGSRLQYRPTRLSFAGAGARDTMQVALVERDGNQCALCLVSFPPYYRPEFDHIVPRSLGGPDDIDNRQLAHKSCNMAKSNNPDWKLSGHTRAWFDRVDGVWREVLVEDYR